MCSPKVCSEIPTIERSQWLRDCSHWETAAIIIEQYCSDHKETRLCIIIISISVSCLTVHHRIAKLYVSIWSLQSLETSLILAIKRSFAIIWIYSHYSLHCDLCRHIKKFATCNITLIINLELKTFKLKPGCYNHKYWAITAM